MSINLVRCSKCQSWLGITPKNDRGDIVIEAEPCDACLKESEKQGYDHGHDDGYKKGTEDAEQ